MADIILRYIIAHLNRLLTYFKKSRRSVKWSQIERRPILSHRFTIGNRQLFQSGKLSYISQSMLKSTGIIWEGIILLGQNIAFLLHWSISWTQIAMFNILSTNSKGKWVSWFIVLQPDTMIHSRRYTYIYVAPAYDHHLLKDRTCSHHWLIQSLKVPLSDLSQIWVKLTHVICLCWCL